MAKINFSKAEEKINRALQNMRMKKLAEGSSVPFHRAVEFYGIDSSSRPPLEDSVEKVLAEDEIEEERKAQETEEKEEAKEEEDTEEQYEDLVIERSDVSLYETMAKARPRKDPPPTRPEIAAQEAGRSDTESAPASPLLILRKHILWLKIEGIQDRYERLGTSKQEVFGLRKKERLSAEDVARIEQLNKVAEEVKKKILEEQEKDSDEKLIEHQKKKHKNKYLSVRDRWLKL